MLLRVFQAVRLIVLAALMLGLGSTASADLITYSETEPEGDPVEGPIPKFTILNGAVEVVPEPGAVVLLVIGAVAVASGGVTRYRTRIRMTN
jgi:hypothetical protein